MRNFLVSRGNIGNIVYREFMGIIFQLTTSKLWRVCRIRACPYKENQARTLKVRPLSIIAMSNDISDSHHSSSSSSSRRRRRRGGGGGGGGGGGSSSSLCLYCNGQCYPESSALRHRRSSTQTLQDRLRDLKTSNPKP